MPKTVSESREAKRNRERIEAFANVFDPPLNVVATQAIGGEPVRNAFMAACWDGERKVGATAVAWNAGNFKAWIEAAPEKKDTGAPKAIGERFAAFLRDY